MLKKWSVWAKNNRRFLFWPLIWIALFWKCKYGYATLDEAFYPTIGYRFLQGDAILYEEWSNTQLYGVLMIPVLKLWLWINGDMTGVYLYIRYVYTVFKIGIAILVYIRLRRYDKTAAFATSSFFLIFSAYGMMVLSYNSFAFGGMVVALVLFLNDDVSLKSNLARILSGIALSIAVLGIPYIALVYVIYAIAVILVKVCYKKDSGTCNETIASCYSPASFMYVSIGVAISVLLYMAYVFTHSTFTQILQTIPHILYGDPAHKAKSLYGLTLAFFVRILIGNHHNYILFMVYAVIILTMVVYILDKKRKERSGTYVILSSLLTFVLMAVYTITDNYINNIAFIPVVYGIMLAIIMDTSSIWTLFYTICVPGIIATYAEHIASNTGFVGIAAASCIPAVGSVMIIALAVSQLSNDRKPEYRYIKVLLVILMCCCSLYRLTYVFWESEGIPSLTTRINYGVCRGLLVTPETAKTYDAIYEDTEDIRNLSEDVKVLYVGDKVLWMAGGQRCGSYSPLCYSILNHTDILWDYYNEHPNKIPDVIYIQDSNNDSFVAEVKNKLGYKIQKRSNGYYCYYEAISDAKR